ncbi:MAG: WYL domain-containing protein [Myxococcales bacterium]|nr:WYL domain-containing protein [Myxococcales bacterium]
MTRGKPVAPPRPHASRAKRLAGEDGERRGRQVTRHLMLLRALSAAPRGLTVQELRGVVADGTLRTLYRDLEHLQTAGFALSNDSGRWLVEPRSLISLPVQADETLALLVASQAVGSAGPFAAPLQELRAKLLATMSPARRAYCDELGRTSVATTLGQPSVGAAVVAAAREAIEKEHRLAITHAKAGEPARRRVVDPYALWLADGRSYLIARPADKPDAQHFNFARITAAEVLDETFDKDPGFNLDEYAARGFGAFHGPVHDVVIELDADVAHVARENEHHASQRLEDLAGGRVRLRMRTAGLPRLAAWIAGFGGKARAIAPPELVERVRELAVGAARGHEA